MNSTPSEWEFGAVHYFETTTGVGSGNFIKTIKGSKVSGSDGFEFLSHPFLRKFIVVVTAFDNDTSVDD